MVKVNVKNTATPLLKDLAYAKIKELILAGQFAPGSFLSERELIEMLDMSKTPIKSALVRLESEGFVTVSSKQGIIINDLTIDQILDIYDLRTALETFNCRKLTGQLSDAQCAELEQNLKETEVAIGILDVNEFTRLDHTFHLMICQFVGNQEIYRILLNYQDHLQRITFKHLNKDPQRMKDFWQEHVALYDYLKAGDSRCIDVMENHLQDSKRKLFL
ncbi:GntR family transcriptional regulator [Planococcus sp. YIM B11945]|uniref:GntR family transcriptional regulator n=1 Tax=Planococcus sp. YIM B11945 TaxID=3435410 RepID=UPI003D7CEE61